MKCEVIILEVDGGAEPRPEPTAGDGEKVKQGKVNVRKKGHKRRR